MIAACGGTVYGYLRVSTAAQSHERQVDAMEELGVKEENMYFDKQSGKDFERPAYQELAGRLQEGDLLVIKSLDRLGRNTTEAKEQWRILTKEKKVSIVVIDTPILNAGKELGPLGQAVSDIIFTIFSLISDFDRHSIWQRMHEGMVVAMRERGVKPGRKALPIPAEFEAVRKGIISGEISQRAAAKKMGVDRKTLKKWINQGNAMEQDEAQQLVEAIADDMCNGMVLADKDGCVEAEHREKVRTDKGDELRKDRKQKVKTGAEIKRAVKTMECVEETTNSKEDVGIESTENVGAIAKLERAGNAVSDTELERAERTKIAQVLERSRSTKKVVHREKIGNMDLLGEREAAESVQSAERTESIDDVGL
ncbi:MAG: recombinase family protein [Lachnospiraceae bacterium]|nr:recombinase family protein [Lachnospiraceae bacterium]